MDRKLFALLAALVVVMVLAIPVMAQETTDSVPPTGALPCLAQGMSALEVNGFWSCMPGPVAQVATMVPPVMPSVAQPEATEEPQLILTAEEAERLVLEVLRPALPSCTDDFLSGQMISFLRTETYADEDLNQWGSKLREDLSEGLIVAVNSCAMLSLVGTDGRIQYDVAGWSVYDGTESVDVNYDGVPTTFWWSAQGVVHQGDVVIGPVSFAYEGPQQFTAGAFSDNIVPGYIPVGQVLGGPECVLAFQAGTEGSALQAACLPPVELASASANR
jgi:hypothetical protein